MSIIIDTIIPSSDTDLRALYDLKESHTFSKIFLVEENHKVTEIYSNYILHNT